MTAMTTTDRPTHAYLDALDTIIADVIAPHAAEVDRAGVFPRAALDALGAAGLLGLISASEVGGLGYGHRAAALVVERIAHHCASTAMVVCMHYAAAAVVEAHGPREDRAAIAAGRSVATLALSESGSRSHFWAPVSTATTDGNGVRLDAHKSWVTAAGEADLYVWSSRPLAADGASTMWLVPSDSAGLRVAAPFDGLGLRGNCSSPVVAEGVVVPRDAMLGADGAGFDVMMAAALPYFQTMSAAMCVGLMDATTTRTAAHAGSTTFTEVGQSLADLPTIRAYIARMRVAADMARGLLLDALDALEGERDDTLLRVLEVKAAAGEAATPARRR